MTPSENPTTEAGANAQREARADVRSILNKMERSIDAARRRRLGENDRPNGQAASLTPDDRLIGMGSVPGGSREADRGTERPVSPPTAEPNGEARGEQGSREQASQGQARPLPPGTDPKPTGTGQYGRAKAIRPTKPDDDAQSRYIGLSDAG